MRLPISEVARLVRETTDFKTNCNLVIIDFLIRHGYAAVLCTTGMQQWGVPRVCSSGVCHGYAAVGCASGVQQLGVPRLCNSGVYPTPLVWVQGLPYANNGREGSLQLCERAPLFCVARMEDQMKAPFSQAPARHLSQALPISTVRPLH